MDDKPIHTSKLHHLLHKSYNGVAARKRYRQELVRENSTSTVPETRGQLIITPNQLHVNDQGYTTWFILPKS